MTEQEQKNVTRASPKKIFRPDTDILETESSFILFTDLPDMDKQSLQVQLDENELTIRGKSTWKPPQGFTLGYAEYEMGDYERTFQISNDIDREQIEANFTNGVLRLTLPKAKALKPRKVEIKTD